MLKKQTHSMIPQHKGLFIMFFPENLSRRAFNIIATIAVVTLIAACGHVDSQAKYPTADRDDHANANDIYAKPDSILGKDGLGLGLFGHKKEGEDAGATGIGVNSFLWRASLDTVAFMPLASADPFGGTILTDWYAPPDAHGERYKLNVLILDKRLRSDGVQVKVFKQTFQRGAWRDDAVPAGMGRKIEDAILTRARQLRVAQMGNQ